LARETGSRRTRLSYFSAIAASVCLLLTSSAVLYLLFSSSKQNNTFADLSLEQLNGIQFQRIQEATRMKRDVDGADVAPRLLDLGNRLIANVDLDGGRLVFAEAAEKGSASAALSLGSTFDPNEASTRNDSSDLAKAKFWYLRAKTLGEQSAQARLEKLDSLATPR
jgi:TPR repeat protein